MFNLNYFVFFQAFIVFSWKETQHQVRLFGYFSIFARLNTFYGFVMYTAQPNDGHDDCFIRVNICPFTYYGGIFPCPSNQIPLLKLY